MMRSNILQTGREYFLSAARLLLIALFAGLMSVAGHCVARAEKRTVVVLGDSLAQGLGLGVSRCYGGALAVSQKGKVSTGLAKKRPVDWTQEAVRLASIKPDLAIVQIGANDIMPVSQNGKLVQFGSAAWKTEYGRRVSDIISAFQKQQAKVIWVGLPYPRREDYQKPYRLISDAQMAAAKADSAAFVDIWKSFLVDGAYSTFGLDVNDKKALLRAEDGIHFTEAGYIKVASLLSAEMRQLLSMRSLRCEE
jgi:hypothetical protein